MKRRTGWALLLGAGLALQLAFGAAAPNGGATVRITDRGLEPAAVTINVGETVTWENQTDRDFELARLGGAGDGVEIEEGASWSRRFNRAGTSRYQAETRSGSGHTIFSGRVVVTGVATPTPTGTPGATPTPTPPPPTASVAIVDLDYQPRSLSMAVGTTVVWTNQGRSRHTVTSDSGLFHSGDLDPGGQYRRTFDQPGSFPYFCAYHPEMRGTVTVG